MTLWSAMRSPTLTTSPPRQAMRNAKNAMTEAERAGLLLGLGALVREFAVLHGADAAPRY